MASPGTSCMYDSTQRLMVCFWGQGISHSSMSTVPNQLLTQLATALQAVTN